MNTQQKMRLERSFIPPLLSRFRHPEQLRGIRFCGRWWPLESAGLALPTQAQLPEYGCADAPVPSRAQGADLYEAEERYRRGRQMLCRKSSGELPRTRTKHAPQLRTAP